MFVFLCPQAGFGRFCCSQRTQSSHSGHTTLAWHAAPQPVCWIAVLWLAPHSVMPQHPENILKALRLDRQKVAVCRQCQDLLYSGLPAQVLDSGVITIRMHAAL